MEIVDPNWSLDW